MQDLNWTTLGTKKGSVTLSSQMLQSNFLSGYLMSVSACWDEGKEYHHSWQMWCVCLDIWGENGGVGSCWWLPPTFTSSSPLTLVPPTSCQPPPAHPHPRQSSQASKFPLYQVPSWQPGHWCGNVEPILGEGSAPIIPASVHVLALRGVRALRWNSWGWSRQSKPQFGSVAFSSIGSYSAQKV